MAHIIALSLEQLGRGRGEPVKAEVVKQGTEAETRPQCQLLRTTLHTRQRNTSVHSPQYLLRCGRNTALAPFGTLCDRTSEQGRQLLDG